MLHTPVEHARQLLAQTQCFLLDLDGTLYLGDALIDGTQHFLHALGQAGKQRLFVTNNSSKNALLYQQKLQHLGVDATIDEIITSTQAAAVMLNQLHAGAKVFVLGNEAMQQELVQCGVMLEEHAPDVLLLGYDTTLNYDRLNAFCRYIQQGLPYYATHADLVCPTPWGYAPDAGSMLAMIESATAIPPVGVAGKPEKGILKLAVMRTGMPQSAMMICGDRLYTDIALGNLHDIPSVLVLSGESSLDGLAQSPYDADIVVDQLSELVDLI
ncbi:HAD-IIA family hydrolase [Eubacteriales bacterium OttesenSCG-928-N14]|nr:HAD-IIA family hydrolase [Eubacteriales bacterium OttesenSCG-928-N14]